MKADRLFSSKEAQKDLIITIILYLISIVTILILIQKAGLDLSLSLENYFSTSISIAVPLLGLLIAAYALLLNFPITGVMKNLQNHESYPLLFDYFILSLFIVFIFLIVSLIGEFLVPDAFMIWYSLIPLFFMIYTCVSISRIIRLLRLRTKLLLKS